MRGGRPLSAVLTLIPKPQGNAAALDAHSSSVEGGEDGLEKTGFLQLPQKALTAHRVGGPDEVDKYVNTRDEDLVLISISSKESVCSRASLKVHNHLCCIVSIERQLLIRPLLSVYQQT